MGRPELAEAVRRALARMEAGGDPADLIGAVRVLVPQHIGEHDPSKQRGGPRNGLVLDICKAVRRFVSGDPAMNAMQLRAYLWTIEQGNPTMMDLPRQMLEAINRVLTANARPEELLVFTKPPAIRDSDPGEKIIEPDGRHFLDMPSSAA